MQTPPPDRRLTWKKSPGGALLALHQLVPTEPGASVAVPQIASLGRSHRRGQITLTGGGRMNGANIHVIPNDTRDWVVKEGGTEQGPHKFCSEPGDAGS